jgi:hypothetical protein
LCLFVAFCFSSVGAATVFSISGAFAVGATFAVFAAVRLTISTSIFAGVTRGRHLELTIFSTETTQTTLLVGNERRSLEAGIYKVKPA